MQLLMLLRLFPLIRGPISLSPTLSVDLRILSAQKVRDTPKIFIALLREIEPYRGPNGYLWALNWICVKNKHRLIAPIAMLANVEMIHAFSYGTAKQIDRPIFDSSKNEIVFYAPIRDTTIKYNINITFDIAFHETEIRTLALRLIFSRFLRKSLMMSSMVSRGLQKVSDTFDGGLSISILCTCCITLTFGGPTHD